MTDAYFDSAIIVKLYLTEATSPQAIHLVGAHVAPVSRRGTLQQYVGRLHRLHDNKREVVVYDYVDARVPVFRAMYAKRVKGYEAVGYQIQAVGEI